MKETLISQNNKCAAFIEVFDSGIVKLEIDVPDGTRVASGYSNDACYEAIDLHNNEASFAFDVVKFKYHSGQKSYCYTRCINTHNINTNKIIEYYIPDVLYWDYESFDRLMSETKLYTGYIKVWSSGIKKLSIYTPEYFNTFVIEENKLIFKNNITKQTLFTFDIPFDLKQGILGHVFDRSEWVYYYIPNKLLTHI